MSSNARLKKQDVFKTSSRCLERREFARFGKQESVTLKSSSKRFQDLPLRRLQWILETKKCLLRVLFYKAQFLRFNVFIPDKTPSISEPHSSYFMIVSRFLCCDFLKIQLQRSKKQCFE